ncbi:MAG: hypothetical protein K8953_00195 [Proteobacteria bacterium]|nr:hypothetical protein [Pseudomonadota bacterium]
MSDLIGSQSISGSRLAIGETVAVRLAVDTPDGWVVLHAEALVVADDDMGKMLQIQPYVTPAESPTPTPEPELIE